MEELKKVQLINVRIRIYSHEIEDIKRIAAYVKNKMTNRAKTMEYINAWQQIIEKIKTEQGKLVKARNDIIKRINSLPDSRYSNLLFKKFVEQKSLEQIADEMAYSFDYIHRMHAEAVKAYEAIYPGRSFR